MDNLHNDEITEENNLTDEELAEEITAPASNYISKEEQYNDSKSSGFTFLLVGIVGAAIIILNNLHILKVKFIEGPLFTIVMGAVFLAFIVIGILSYIKSHKLRAEAESEKDFTNNLLDDFFEKYPADAIDSDIDSQLSEELKYFERIRKITDLLNEMYPDLDSKYIEAMSEKIFEKLFD